MIRVMTPKESCLSFLIELGSGALVSGAVGENFSKFHGGRETYERAFLELLQDMRLPVTSNECSLVDCKCPSHWSSNRREEDRRVNSPKVKRESNDE